MCFLTTHCSKCKIRAVRAPDRIPLGWPESYCHFQSPIHACFHCSHSAMLSASTPASGCLRPRPCQPRLTQRPSQFRVRLSDDRQRVNSQKQFGDAPGSAPEDLGVGKAAAPAAAGAPQGPPSSASGGSDVPKAAASNEDDLLQPPSTVTGPAPAGIGIDAGSSTCDQDIQQGSGPEDATAEGAGGGSKTYNLSRTSGTAAQSVSMSRVHLPNLASSSARTACIR